MPTLWNSATQTPDCYDVCNTVLRNFGLSVNGGLITDFDIYGEPAGTSGRIKGIAEYCGVYPSVVKQWFARKGTGKKYSRCLRLADTELSQGPGNPTVTAYSLTGRMISYLTYPLDAGGSLDFAETEKFKPLRARVFLAGLLTGGIERAPIYTGKTAKQPFTIIFPGLADTIDYAIQEVIIAPGNTYRRMSWFRMYIQQVVIDGSNQWQLIVFYNNPNTGDIYEEDVTDCNGTATGEKIGLI